MKRLLILLIFIISLIAYSVGERPPFTDSEILASFPPDIEGYVLKRDVIASRILIQNIECPIAIKWLENGRNTLMIKIIDANYFPDVCKEYFFLSEVDKKTDIEKEEFSVMKIDKYRIYTHQELMIDRNLFNHIEDEFSN